MRCRRLHSKFVSHLPKRVTIGANHLLFYSRLPESKHKNNYFVANLTKLLHVAHNVQGEVQAQQCVMLTILL